MPSRRRGMSRSEDWLLTVPHDAEVGEDTDPALLTEEELEKRISQLPRRPSQRMPRHADA